MKYEKDDINELYKSIGMNSSSYLEIKEYETIINIKKKWLHINEILSFVKRNPSNYKNKGT